MKIFFLVLARDQNHVESKINELQRIGFPFVVVCGQKLNYPNLVYREPKGKFDAINFGFSFVPKDTEVLVLNDVDTQIYNFTAALKYFKSEKVTLLFCRVSVKDGPQGSFYTILDFIRRRLPIVASGELMLIKKDFFAKMLPIKTCKAEDSYILFKTLQLKNKVIFCEECYVKTERTKTLIAEENYKRRTTLGVYQALRYTHPPKKIRLFYFLLPLLSPALLIMGPKGFSWTKGIMHGYSDYLRGDISGVWS
jgi:cellulose synthase/poly-beta-1,6-N-acetylglucosamine synthase-like glycosyltransferase